MAFLQKGDFANGKTASMGPYAGKTRHQIVEAKIKDKRDFFLGDKGKGGKVKGKKYDPKTMMFTFEYLSGKNKGKQETTIIIGATGEKIFKDPDFGSGGGAGGGTLQTAYAESLQCVWIVACLKNPRKKFEDFTEKDLKAAFDDSRCQVGGTLFKKMMGVDSSWNKSGFDTAKKLISDGYVNKNHAIHRDSTLMNKVNKDFGTHKVEIILTTARGGGAGWGVIQDIVKDVLGPSHALPDNALYQRRTKMILEKNQTEINRFWNLARASGYGSKYSKKAFVEKLLEKNKFWIHAKYGALSLIGRLDSTTKTKANKIVNKINNYAGSQSDLSSVYIKVYE